MRYNLVWVIIFGTFVSGCSKNNQMNFSKISSVEQDALAQNALEGGTTSPNPDWGMSPEDDISPAPNPDLSPEQPAPSPTTEPGSGGTEPGSGGGSGGGTEPGSGSGGSGGGTEPGSGSSGSGGGTPGTGGGNSTPSPIPTPKPFVGEEHMSDVDDTSDAFIPNNGLTAQSPSDIKWVKRCDAARMEEEYQIALEEVQNDPTHRTLIARYQISVGEKLDEMAHLAYQRSILRVDDDGVTPIPVLPSRGLGPFNGYRYAHYKADHKKARQQYIDGERCYFSTIQVIEEGAGIISDQDGVPSYKLNQLYLSNISLPADPKESRSYLYDCLWSSNVCKLPVTTTPNPISLFVADFRENLMEFPNSGTKLLNPEFVHNAIRSSEYSRPLKEIFDFEVLWTQRNHITAQMTRTRDVDGQIYSAYEGVPQLIDNIIFSGLNGVVMSTQYTPITLDLGARNVRTSSLEWGTFFNLAGLNRAGQGTTPEPFNISHLTAWLGGPIERIADSFGRLTYTRVAEDGFLVRPKGYGRALTGRDLFGSLLEVDRVTYTDGFAALRALTKKDCTSSKVEDRYFGPWDGQLFESTIRVWIDRDRNGSAERDELKTLRQAGVVALNTCNIVHKNEFDRFGNKTALRSAFLYASNPGSALFENSDEIKKRLQTGDKNTSDESEFRLAIDLFLKVKTDLYLQNVKPHEVEESGNPLGPKPHPEPVGPPATRPKTPFG